MNKTRMILAGALLFAGALAAAGRPDDKAALPETVSCSVMPDHKVNVKEATAKGMYRDYEYGRYYFCCAGCPPTFDKDPKKFAANAGVKLADLGMPSKIACAVMAGNQVDVKEATGKNQFADYNGRRYYFCCGNCPEAFKKDPAKFAKSASVAIGQLPLPKETACAVQTGKTVNVADALAKGRYADYNGKRYVFCCGGCPGAFKADPAKFAANASIPSPAVVEKAETK